MTSSEAYTILDELAASLAGVLLGMGEDTRLARVTNDQIEALTMAKLAIDELETRRSRPTIAVPVYINDDGTIMSQEAPHIRFTSATQAASTAIDQLVSHYAEARDSSDDSWRALPF